jgi:alkylation response protein AidB-like acyl-CoA dehydrogenase
VELGFRALVDIGAIIASSFVPAGTARRTPAGYRLSGRWSFSSGVDTSAWNMLAGVVEDGPPDHRVFLLHRSQYEIHDVLLQRCYRCRTRNLEFEH